MLFKCQEILPFIFFLFYLNQKSDNRKYKAEKQHFKNSKCIKGGALESKYREGDSKFFKS
ncbi:MAG: hypothetical protein BGO76_06135 [Caedibacter sp. 38-128]|nr:MAG: hypothetical protein BGO76_06135 [Caedibacter sp. 38-128]